MEEEKKTVKIYVIYSILRISGGGVTVSLKIVEDKSEKVRQDIGTFTMREGEHIRLYSCTQELPDNLQNGGSISDAKQG